MPVVMMAPPFIKVVPPELVVRLVSASTPPTILPKVVILEEIALRLNVPLRVLLKRIVPAPVLRTVFPFSFTVSLKVSASFEVEILTPTMAGLVTVKALLKLEEVVAKETPVPPALRVVIPVMVPPPVTLLTTITPIPEAVIDKPPVVVIKSSSASVRLKPGPAVPRKTSTPELPAKLTKPVAFNAAPIEISAALDTMSEVRSAELPTVPTKVMAPVPAVKPRLKAPLSVPPKVMPAPALREVLALRLTASLKV